MNIKNLRQIYQKQGNLPPKPPPIPQNKLPTVNISSNNAASIHKPAEPPKQIQTISIVQPSNKNFLEQLNKKLDPNSSVHSFSRTGGFSYVLPPPVVQQEKKKQMELSFNDIIQEAAEQQLKQPSNLKMRYGIDEHNPHGNEQRSLFQTQKLSEPVNQNGSFSQLLQNMIKGLNLTQNCSTEIITERENQKFRPISIYQYGEANTSLEQKLRRIDFVMDVIFRETKFQIVSQSQLHTKKPIKQPEIQDSHIQAKRQSKINTIKKQSLIGLKQSVKVPPSYVVEQPISINGNFLAELSSKIKKKQTVTIASTMQASNKQPEVQNNESIKQPQVVVAQNINRQRSVTPVKRKKAKQHQNFDEM